MNDYLLAAWQASSVWEALAVVLAIAYLLLAIRQNIWCWAAALLSTCIYLVLFFGARLYMESALQIFYAVMAVYGWSQWRGGDPKGNKLRVSRWPWTRHALAIGAILVLSTGSGRLLMQYSNAAIPYLDSFTTWASIVTTYMVARKILENWFYWFVIDSASIYLYLDRELYLTALLFCIYLVLIVVGFVEWQKSHRRDHTVG